MISNTLTAPSIKMDLETAHTHAPSYRFKDETTAPRHPLPSAPVLTTIAHDLRHPNETSPLIKKSAIDYGTLISLSNSQETTDFSPQQFESILLSLIDHKQS